MGPVLKLMVLFTALTAIGALFMMAMTAAKKRQLREELDALPFEQLQNRARELWRRGEVLAEVFRTRASSASMYGSEGEVLAEALMHSVFSQPDALEERHPLLVAHYTWLLQLLVRYMEAKWSWTDMPEKPSLKSHQIFFQDPGSTMEHYPRPQAGVLGLELNQTLRWLGAFAAQHSAFVRQSQREHSAPSWNADLFTLKTQNRTFGISNLSLYQIQCTPPDLLREIARLAPTPSGPATA